MPKDVKYIIIKFSANVVAISTKITCLLIIRECQTRRPIKCKGAQNHILRQDAHALVSMRSELFFPGFFSYQVPKNTNSVMPRSSLMSIGIPWHMRHRGVPNTYSTVTSYQVPSSSKYYSMPRSLLVGIGIPWYMRHRGVPNAYSTVYFMKCQIVWNISQCWELFHRFLALSWHYLAHAVPGSVKCESTAYFYGVSNSLKYFTTLRTFSLFLGVTFHMQCHGVSSFILRCLIIKPDYFEIMQQ